MHLAKVREWCTNHTDTFIGKYTCKKSILNWIDPGEMLDQYFVPIIGQEYCFQLDGTIYDIANERCFMDR